MSLPPMAQYIIGTTYHVAKWEEFQLNQDMIVDMIFMRVIEKNLYKDFKASVFNYKVVTNGLNK